MEGFKTFRRFSCILAVFIILFTGVSVYASAPKSADTVTAGGNSFSGTGSGTVK